MSGRPSAAVRDFKDWLQQAISCITQEVLLVSENGYRASPPDSEPHSVAFRHAVPLRGPSGLSLSVRHLYRVIRPQDGGRWRIKTAGYYYWLEDAYEREVLAFHWHPEQVPDVPYPHLHIGHGAVSMETLQSRGASSDHNALRPDLATAHVPTGRVALEDVIGFAIRHLNADPLRDDWETTLANTRRTFESTRSW